MNGSDDITNVASLKDFISDNKIESPLVDSCVGIIEQLFSAIIPKTEPIVETKSTPKTEPIVETKSDKKSTKQDVDSWTVFHKDTPQFGKLYPLSMSRDQVRSAYIKTWGGNRNDIRARKIKQ
jgi:hypothetical protein